MEKADEEAIRVFASQKKAIVCINDTEIVEFFEEVRRIMIAAFGQILPNNLLLSCGKAFLMERKRMNR